jgi:hypothetical protein
MEPNFLFLSAMLCCALHYPRLKHVLWSSMRELQECNKMQQVILPMAEYVSSAKMAEVLRYVRTNSEMLWNVRTRLFEWFLKNGC